MREFDMTTQRSTENIEKIEILPATDVLMTKKQINDAVKSINNALNNEKKVLKNEESYAKLADTVENLLGRIKEQKLFSSYAVFLDKISEKNPNITE